MTVTLVDHKDQRAKSSLIRVEVLNRVGKILAKFLKSNRQFPSARCLVQNKEEHITSQAHTHSPRAARIVKTALIRRRRLGSILSMMLLSPTLCTSLFKVA